MNNIQKFQIGDLVFIHNMKDFVSFNGKVGKIQKAYRDTYLLEEFDSFYFYDDELILISKGKLI